MTETITMTAKMVFTLKIVLKNKRKIQKSMLIVDN